METTWIGEIEEYLQEDRRRSFEEQLLTGESYFRGTDAVNGGRPHNLGSVVNVESDRVMAMMMARQAAFISGRSHGKTMASNLTESFKWETWDLSTTGMTRTEKLKRESFKI